MAEPIHDADRLRVGVRPVSDTGVAHDVVVPFGPLGLCLRGPFAGRGISCGGLKLGKSPLAVADHGCGQVLGGIVPGHVQADEPGVLCKCGPGTCREVLKPGADGQNQVGFLGDGICAVGPGHADRTDVQRVVVQEIGTPGDRFHDWDPGGFGKRREFGHGIAILNAAARDDHRALRQP